MSLFVAANRRTLSWTVLAGTALALGGCGLIKVPLPPQNFSLKRQDAPTPAVVRAGGLVTIDDTLRPIIAELVRAEVARVLAERKLIDGDGFMSTTAAATYAGVALGTIRRWIRERKLPEHHAGRHLRVRRGDLDALIRGVEPAPSTGDWAARVARRGRG